MPLDFLSGATGQPTNLKRMIAFQEQLGVPPLEDAYVDTRTNGGPFTIESQEIDRLAIQGRGEPGQNLVGKLALGGGPLAMGDVDVADRGILKLLANVVEKYDITFGPAAALAVTSITQAAGTATITTAAVHGLTGTVRINVSGAVQGGYNGSHLATVTGADTMTFAVDAATVSPATGTILYGAALYARVMYHLRGGTQAAPYIAVINDNDVLPRQTIFDLLFNGFTLAAGPSANFRWSFPWAGGQFTFADPAVQTAGTGSDLPRFFRTWVDYSDWDTGADERGVFTPDADAAENRIYFKVTNVDDIADPGAERVTVQVKIGASASYSHSFTFYLGRTDQRLYDESGRRIGDKAEQLHAYIPVGATLVAADEFTSEVRRQAWAQSLQIERPISSVMTSFLIAGQEERIEGGWTIAVGWEGTEQTGATGGRQPFTPDRTGELQVVATPTRRLTNLDLQAAAFKARSLSLVVDAETRALIPGSGVPFRVIAVMPAAQPFGQLFDAAEGAQNKEEAMGLRAGIPNSAMSFDAGDHVFSIESHFALIVYCDALAI